MGVVDNFKQKLRSGKYPDKIYETAIEIGKSNPEYIGEILMFLIVEHPTGSTLFTDLVSYLPYKDFPELIAYAIKNLKAEHQNNGAIQDVLSLLSLQAVKSLHPYLDTLYHLNLDSPSYDVVFPWRESESIHFDFLCKEINDATHTWSQRRGAYWRLLQTRAYDAFTFLEVACNQLWRNNPNWSRFDRDLQHVGFELNDKDFRRLYHPHTYHITFSKEYRTMVKRPYWLQWTHHPTWDLQITSEIPQVFGGPQNGECLVCGNELHHLITMNPIPNNLHISKLEQLTLATCLSCIGWETEPLFYQHDRDGQPTNIEYSGEKRKPITQYDPLLQTDVYLIGSGERWRWQEHAMANSRQNLHRVGGHPTWIQSAEFLTCPRCNKTMCFILQLDDGLIDIHNDDLSGIFGDNGTLYMFWCDNCCISACFWQNY